jgi:small subunit ribosomal protein S18
MRRSVGPTIAGRQCTDWIPDYKDVEGLKKFLNGQAQIHSRRRTGYCAQCQKALKLAVKRARHLALLPFVG